MIRDKVSVEKKVKFTYITTGALLVVSANSVNVGETGSLKMVKWFNSKHSGGSKEGVREAPPPPLHFGLKKKKSQNLEKPAGKAKQKHPHSRSNLKVCIRH